MNILLNGFVHLGLILILSAITLAAAISFAIRPGERKLGILRHLSLAMTSFLVAEVIAGIGATMFHLSESSAAASEMGKVLVSGLAEATVPAIIGFTFLGMSWLLAVVGLRRQL
jgi:hypothetical protein